MTQRLFQDAGGTTPAVIAGQPVGLVKKLAGSVDAVQATALSKPTLARWPKGGVRNILNGGDAYGVSPYYRNGNSTNGIIPTFLGKFTEGGRDFGRWSLSGTSNQAGLKGVTNQLSGWAVRGASYRSTSSVRLVRGADQLPGEMDGVRMDYSIRDSMGNILSSHVVGSTKSSEWTHLSGTRLLDAEGASIVYFTIGIRCDLGAVLDNVIIDVSNPTLTLTSEADLPRQLNYGPNDIIEPGVADLWHLYNDGGDSLNVTLPAGTYGLASIDINRAITITTITSDGTTPINTLRHERQLDVILRAGAFTSGEETAIRDYWGRIFA